MGSHEKAVSYEAVFSWLDVQHMLKQSPLTGKRENFSKRKI